MPGLLSRRRMLAGTGIAIGAGALGTAATVAPASAATTSSFALVGTAMRRLGPRGRAAPGSSSTVRGTLHRTGGGIAGEFFSTGTVLAEHRMLEPQLGWLETHLFALTDGTITGIGTVHHDGTGAFTITGGSGRYAAARGSYTTRQTADHSGTGQALFTFTIG